MFNEPDSTYDLKMYNKYTVGIIYENNLDDPFLILKDKKMYYDLSEEHYNFIRKLTIDDMNNLTEDILNSKLLVGNTGFDTLFTNKNTIHIDDTKLIQILEIFLKRKQRLFEYTYYYILPYSDAVRNWVYKNLKVNDYEVCIEDKENY